MNQGKTEIIILGNFIVHKDILKMLKLENPMIVQILSLAIFGQIQESKRIENADMYWMLLSSFHSKFTFDEGRVFAILTHPVTNKLNCLHCNT